MSLKLTSERLLVGSMITLNLKKSRLHCKEGTGLNFSLENKACLVDAHCLTLCKALAQ
jgi:hypothetical protein